MHSASPSADDPKISMIIPSGERIERLPAWIKRVTQDLSVSPVYDARFWNPPASQRYTFKHSRPPTPKSLRIYEAHVGISTSEGRVGTYNEFAANILPRIKKLGYNTIQLMAIQEHPYYACRPSFQLTLSLFDFPPKHLDTRSPASLLQALDMAHLRNSKN